MYIDEIVKAKKICAALSAIAFSERAKAELARLEKILPLSKKSR